MAAEAHLRRRELEQTQRSSSISRAHMMHERFFGHNSSALSSILRNTVNRIGSSYIVHGSGGRGSDAWRHSFGGRGASAGVPGHPVSSLLASNAIKVKGRQLLDQEGLSCLLIILFIDDPKINTTRLHRILRNLCYHAPTREWVVKSLLSILEKSNEGKQQNQLSSINYVPNQNDSCNQISAQVDTPPTKMRKSTNRSSASNDNTSNTGSNVSSSITATKSEGRTTQPSWLNIS